MASASRDPRRGEMWSAHASAILPILQAAAACSLVGLSEAMMSDKTSLESARLSKLRHRPCLIIRTQKGSATCAVVVLTTCGGDDITQLSAHSQFFAVAVGNTRPWPDHTSPVLNVLPAWPKSFETPAYAIAYIVSIPRSALVGRWYENGAAYKNAQFFCDEDDVEELEAICDERRSLYMSLGPEERARWDRTYEVSRREWLAGRRAETNLSTMASDFCAHRHAFTEQLHSAGRPAQDSALREQHAYQRPPPIASPSHRPAQLFSARSQMPTAVTQDPDGLSNLPRPQASPTRASQAGLQAPDPPRAQEFPPLREPLNTHDTLHYSKEATTPDTTPTGSPSSLADSLSTSDSEASPGAGPARELHDDEHDGRSTAKEPVNNLLLSLDGLDGDDAETVAGTISYSQIVKGVGVPRAEPVASNMDVAAAEPQQGKKAKRISRVNIFAIGLRMGAGTRTTLF